jgi:hypothetical protein
MKLLMLGGDTDTRSALNRLLLKSEHVLEWRTELDIRGLNLSNYDTLLVDGTPREYTGRLQLQRLLREISNRSPETTILLFSTLNGPARAKEYGERSCHHCGIFKSERGEWQFRCRLHEFALMEYEALLHEAVKSPANEPITLAYQGDDL